jgi:ABC-type amino acid transport substrate-binding protein
MKYFTRYGLWLAAAIVVFILVYAVITVVNYRPPSEFTMATGREGGAYDKFAQEYQRLLAEKGYALNLVPTAGSEENLDLLEQGKVDVALVQTGVATEQQEENLSSLASLFYEPLWIFYRLRPGDEPARFIADLTDRDIAIGEERGGTHDLALFILEENGITAENATLYPLSNADAAGALLNGEIDVVFMIASPEAESVQVLLTAPGIELLSVERVLAYRSRYNDITTVTLGEGAVDLSRNIPGEDKVLLTAVAAFVAEKHLSPDLARVLLTVAKEVHGPGGLLEDKGEFPSSKLVQIPMDATAEAYLDNGPTGLDRFFPIWVASRLERMLFLLVPFLVLLYPLFRTTPLAVAFFFRFRINRWYRHLRQIELSIDTMSVQELEEHILWLDDLEQDLAKRLAVPMMYLADVYLLRFQVGQVNQRLERRMENLRGEPYALKMQETGGEAGPGNDELTAYPP